MIDAGKAIEEAEEFIQGEEQAKKRCFVGLCPDLKTRYLLSKKAEKKALAIDKLVNEGDHGVGKTTLAKEVHRQAIEEKLFDEVVMVAVNQHQNSEEFNRR
ncbi:hypothetical protein GH714_012513 [Hevea brasiliensis]|uniref:NB-ARC domain-containing protein n=1 Tax=Hevea brasiliensis TaxID=3981 RepID=A0A6A6KZP8_HEVBR|nr:hypothetical protein GH714_012513 [Hevea brasiliensis]